MDDDDFEYEIQVLPAVKFHPIALAGAAVLLVHGVSRAVVSACDYLIDVIDQHSAFVNEMRDFQSAASREIESITAGSEE